jgi:hypothetical protein
MMEVSSLNLYQAALWLIAQKDDVWQSGLSPAPSTCASRTVGVEPGLPSSLAKESVRAVFTGKLVLLNAIEALRAFMILLIIQVGHSNLLHDSP